MNLANRRQVLECGDEVCVAAALALKPARFVHAEASEADHANAVNCSALHRTSERCRAWPKFMGAMRDKMLWRLRMIQGSAEAPRRSGGLISDFGPALRQVRIAAIFYCATVVPFAQPADLKPKAADPHFSVPHGFFETPFSLSITSTTPDAVIYYSFDASEPGTGQGLTSTGPISIANTTVVRARAFKDGLAPSEVKTQTYLFPADVIHQAPDGRAPRYFPASWGGNIVDYGMDPNVVSQYSLAEWREALTQIPSVSLVTEMKHLFDPVTGIYANALGHGREWERPASIELLDAGKIPQGRFQENCGLRIRGGYSRHAHYAKHSFRVFFRREYGPAKLSYPLFEKEGADEFDTFDLRTSQNYSWPVDRDFAHHDTMVREVFCRETLGALGQPTTRSRFYHLYVNGHYWGLYESQERPEAAYGSSYFRGRKEDYDTVKCANHVGGFVTEATDGNLDAFRRLWTMARSVATNPANSNYFALLGRHADGTRNPALPVLLDADDLIDYMLVIFYTGDGDATLSSFLNNERPNNWFGLRNRNDPDMGFLFFNHDAEHSLGAPYSKEDRTGPFLSARQSDFTYANPQWIHQDLMANAEYRLRFGDHVQRHFFNGGALTPEAGTNRFLRKAAQIDKAIRAYSARWGDAQREPPYGEIEWRSMINHVVHTWFPSRTSVVLEQLKADGLYPSVAPPVIQLQSADSFTLTHSNARGAIVFTTNGADPRLVGGAAAPTGMIYTMPVRLLTATQVLARVQDGTYWSALVAANFFPPEMTSRWPRLAIQVLGNGVTLSFPAAANAAYTLQYNDGLSIDSWRVLKELPAASTNRILHILDSFAGPYRYYRLRMSP